MSESKELLEATVKGLKDKLEQLQTELNFKTLTLKNLKKPNVKAVYYGYYTRLCNRRCRRV